MKKNSLLVVLMAALAFAGCAIVDHTSEMEGFTGTNVEVGDNGAASGLKMLVLNEGPYMGLSTLDVLDLSNKKYYADIFGQANPDVEQGLGSTGNDIELAGGRIWLAMNASNMVVGLNPHTFQLEVEIDMESPRCFASDDDYLYVSSYGSAVYGSEHQIKGKVYRINLKDIKNTLPIEVGYQPEGMVLMNGKLYVANSGGYNAQKDNRVHVIDTETFKLEQVIELPVSNLNMMRKGDNEVWVSTYSTWDASFKIITAPSSLAVFSKDGKSSVIEGVHADKITEYNGTIYAIGNNAEMTYGTEYCLYKVDCTSKAVTTVKFQGTDLERVAYPYCILVNPLNQDIFIADASFTEDSKLHCFTKDLKHRWTVTTGVGTGHLLLYQP